VQVWLAGRWAQRDPPENSSGQRPTPLLALNSERVCRRGGGKLLTLKDAADYITKLPKAEQHHPAWQAAVEALILVAETDGPTMFARIGVMLALNRDHRPTSEPRRKAVKKYEG
jgi:hypothetical protein